MTFCYHWRWKGQDHQAYLSLSFTRRQNLSEERLNSKKLIWFYHLKVFFYLQWYVYLILKLLIIRKLSSVYELYSFLFRLILFCYCKVWTPAIENPSAPVSSLVSLYFRLLSVLFMLMVLFSSFPSYTIN